MPRHTPHEAAMRAVEKQIASIDSRIARLRAERDAAEKVLAQLRVQAKAE